MTRVLSPHAAAAASTSALLVTSSVTGTIRSSSTATESALRAIPAMSSARRSMLSRSVASLKFDSLPLAGAPGRIDRVSRCRLFWGDEQALTELKEARRRTTPAMAIGALTDPAPRGTTVGCTPVRGWTVA